MEELIMPSRNGGPALDVALSRSTFSKALLNATGNTPRATEADVESRLEREILTATVRANAMRADEETRFKQLHRQLPSAGMITELERAHRVRVAPEITRLVRNIIAARRELVLATLGFRG